MTFYFLARPRWRRGLAAEGRACGGGRWTAPGAAPLGFASDLSLDHAWRLRHEAHLRGLRRTGARVEKEKS